MSRLVHAVEPADRILDRAAAHRSALYASIGDKIPFVRNGLHDGEHIRHAMQERVRAMVRAQPVPGIEVRGTVGERLDRARNAAGAPRFEI